MVKNNPTHVFAAFEILLEEIEAEIDVINKAGASAFEERENVTMITLVMPLIVPNR